MSFHHLKVLLKKNLLILKRTYILTFFEIVSPIITIFILLFTNSKFETKRTPIITNKIDYLASECLFITSYNPFSMYCYYQNFIIFSRCRNSTIALIGENFPEKVEKLMNNSYFYSFNFDLKFIYYESFSELKDYIESKTYKNKERICFGISYNKNGDKYTFKLHYFAPKYTKTYPRIPKIPSSNIDNLDPFRILPDFDSFNLYKSSGFLFVQKLLYDYVLQEETGDSNAEIFYKIVPQKYEEKISNFFNEILEFILPLFIIIAYAFPLCINIYRLIKEKESRAKEIMKIMGLDELSYFLSYFIIYIFINTIYALFNSLILNEVINYIELQYLFILFFLYGLAIYSLVFFLQNFLEKANISIIFCLFIYFIIYFIGIPLKTNNINRGFKIIFALLLPPANLLYGCNTITQFQINYNQFNNLKEEYL